MRSKDVLTRNKFAIYSVVTALILSQFLMDDASAVESNSVQAQKVQQDDRPVDHEEVETLRSADGNTLTAKWDKNTDEVKIYVNGIYKNNVSMNELQDRYVQEVERSDQYIQESRCGHILNGVAIANGLLWTVASLSVPAGPAAAVPALGGVVTSGIIGVAGAECKD